MSGISPASGPETGGTAVEITGTGFTGATAVHFGANAATGFTVNSNLSITAVLPSGSGIVDVTATTPTGTSKINANDKFTYIPTYKVTYDGNGSTGGSVPVDNGNYVEGATVTVLVSYELNSLNIGKKNYASATEKLENSEVRSTFFIFKPATIADLPSEVK